MNRSPYRQNVAPPPKPSFPDVDVEAYAWKLRYAAERRDRILEVFRIFGIGCFVLFIVVGIVGLLASDAERAEKCRQAGGGMVEGSCVKVIPLR